MPEGRNEIKRTVIKRTVVTKTEYEVVVPVDEIIEALRKIGYKLHEKMSIFANTEYGRGDGNVTALEFLWFDETEIEEEV